MYFLPFTSLIAVYAYGRRKYISVESPEEQLQKVYSDTRYVLADFSYSTSPLIYPTFIRNYYRIDALKFFLGINFGNVFTFGLTPTLYFAGQNTIAKISVILPLEIRFAPYLSKYFPLIAGISYFNDKFFGLPENSSIFTSYVGARFFGNKYNYRFLYTSIGITHLANNLGSINLFTFRVGITL